MQVGQKQLESYFENVGGLNVTDSTFTVKDSQSTGGTNYEYAKTGAIQKSLCASKINTVADAQLKTLGLFLRHPKAGAKTIVRAAGTKLQSVDLQGNFTNLARDNAAATSDVLTSSTQPVVGSMFVTPSIDALWLAAGLTSIYGVVSDSQYTRLGVDAPTGSITVTEVAGPGTWVTTGTYYYAIVFRKRSTAALSNAALDKPLVLTSITNKVRVDWSALTNYDATLYDKVYIYRSSVGGVDAFTAGVLVAQVDTTSTSYDDNGSSLTDAANIPRAGNTILDNSPLPSGTYKSITTWKRRLVTANESTVYISDINKPESFPASNVITVPSGGPITGLYIISFTPNANSTDEFLVVFKETELWIVSGSNLADWELKFVDTCGTLSQSLVASANGYIYFIDNRGIYLWDGVGKPYYVSRPIESMFGEDGKLNRALLYAGQGVFFKKQNQIVWYLSHNDIGEQKYQLKLDLRLTLPQVKSTMGERILDGVFLPGKVASPVYAAASFVFPTSSSQENLLMTGDDAGFIFRQFYATTGDGANDYDFSYETKYLDQGNPSIIKNYYQVIAWVEDVGNWDLILDYWTDFRSNDSNKHSVPLTINANTDGTLALWDVAKWDEAKWDDFTAKPKRLVFNLASAPYNNSVGEVIKLRFRNQGSDQPVTILGFGIYWASVGVKN